jgi:OPA family glycerol-3-phosphate transporter-like MFS transporter
MPEWLNELLPILILLAVVGVVYARLPKVELGHSPEFLRRRVQNWLPIGICYAFLYMGRYNLTVAKDAFGERMDNTDFATIFAVGTWVYGLSFLINGPLTDKFGGRATILVGAVGAAVANLLMGLLTHMKIEQSLWVPAYSVLYGANMYFQSFGAVAIVKVNAPWFHVRERGAFGGIFGILISLGIYFAYDWSALLIKHFPDDIAMVFYVPAAVLIATAVAVAALVKDTPGEAGLTDFDPGDARDDGPRLGVVAIFKKMLSNPVILTIALIEFCSGFLRQAIMQWYRTFSKQVGLTENFVYENWGMLLCCAGIAGGIVAGLISDRVFGSRRGPVAAVLYGGMLAGGILLTFTYDTNALGPIMVVMSMLIIGVHGMLSGTASMDFGGRKNTGVAVGIIDGFVYAGTGTMSVLYGIILPNGEAAKTASNWYIWPISLIPVALVGLLLSVRVWSATARSPAKAGGGH